MADSPDDAVQRTVRRGAWGITAFYLLLAVEITSLLRQRIPKSLWRKVHFLSFPLFLTATAHGITAGTDMAATAGVVVALSRTPAAAVTIEELQDLFYQTEDAEQFSREATGFIEASEDLADLDHVFNLWESFAPDDCGEWLEARAAEASDEPKYQYLLLNLTEDMQSKISKAKELVSAHPDFAGGYRALLLTFVVNFSPEELDDPESPFYQQLRESLPLLAHFGENFNGDELFLMAQVYYLVQTGDPEAAKLPFRQALEAEEDWIDEMGLGYMFTPNKYHPLMAYQIELLRPKDADP